MITKAANMYLIKEADGLSDLWYNTKDLFGQNSVLDSLKHYGGKAVDAAGGALRASGKAISDAAESAVDTVGKAVSPIGHSIKRFANDSIRGYKDLYKYLTKDPEFLRSLYKEPMNMLERAKRKRENIRAGLRMSAKIHENAANEAAATAATLKPFADAYNTASDYAGKGAAAVGAAAKNALSWASKKIQEARTGQ